MTITRRQWLTAGALAGLGAVLDGRWLAQDAQPPRFQVPASFPSVDRDWVYETVRFAHFDLDRVRALVDKHPALANATMDWGYGDWETAVGAAAHMGRRDIAGYLLERGARPDLFCHAMLGHLNVVRAAVEASPGIQSLRGPHDLSLLHHARQGGEPALPVVDYLQKLGDADPQLPSADLDLPAAAFVGTYAWGDDAAQRLSIGKNRAGALSVHYGDDFGRSLTHVGGYQFRPTGAAAVRFIFEITDRRARRVTLRDHDVVLVAERVADGG